MKLITLLTLLIAVFPAFGQMAGWSNNLPVTIQENSGGQVINYQQKLTINTQALVTAGQMLATGDDIRFTSSCTGGVSFPYWIESGMNTSSTVIWVKIDTLQANAYRTIYMHYNNPGAAAISAINTTFSGPNSATDSTVNTNLSGSSDAQRGFRFAPTTDILVTNMGKYTPGANPRYVTLFDNATQAVLRQTQVAGPEAELSYSSISPIWLNQGTQYLVEIFFPAGDDAYYFGASPTMGQHIQYFDMRYCNGCTQNTFPTNSLGGMLYGYVDFWYWTKNTVSPAPTYTLGSLTLASGTIPEICSGDTVQIPLMVNGGIAPFTFAWTGEEVSDSAIQNPYTSPADTASYTVSVTDNCGTVNTTTFTINVNALPLVNILTNNTVICNGETAVLSVSGTDDYLWSDATTGNTITVMPSATTSYFVSATDANGCVQRDTLVQLVNVPLTAVRNVDICHGETYFFNSHSYTADGIYTDTLAGTTSCDSIVTTNLTVLTLPVSTQNISICYGTGYTIGQHTYNQEGTYIDTIPGMVFCDSIVTTILAIRDEIDTDVQWVNMFTLTADAGADSYQWVDCDNGNSPIAGATSSIFEVTENGSYAVNITVDGCTESSDCFEMAFIGLGEYNEIENIEMYPNPNDGSFSVRTTQSQTLSVFDATGKMVTSVEIAAGQEKAVSLSNVEPGVYFLESQTKTIRFVVE